MGRPATLARALTSAAEKTGSRTYFSGYCRIGSGHGAKLGATVESDGAPVGVGVGPHVGVCVGWNEVGVAVGVGVSGAGVGSSKNCCCQISKVPRTTRAFTPARHIGDPHECNVAKWCEGAGNR